MIEKFLSGFDWQYYVLFPGAVMAGELLVVGWQDSSCRRLLRKGRSVGADWLYWILQSFRFNDLFITTLTLGAFGFLAGRGLSLNVLSNMPPVVQFVIGFVLADFCAYWTHRLFHTVPLLWQFHKIHHSATELNVLLTFRFHPMEKLVWHLQGMAIFLLIGSGLATYAVFTAVDIVLGQIQHARLRWNYGPLSRFIISPTFHRLHHSTDPGDYNRNLGGRLAIWDRMFGTYSAKDIPFDSIGLGEVQPIMAEFVQPFKSMWPSRKFKGTGERVRAS